MNETSYTGAQKALHWIVAALVAAMALTGLAYVYEWADDSIIVAHQVIGQILIIVLVIRISVRIRKGKPLRGHHPRWERVLASSTQVGLYLVMIAFVITGYFAASALRQNALILPIDIGLARSDLGERMLEVHYAIKWVLAGLIFLHVAGALKHVFLDKDDTLSSILPSKHKDIK
ncbi:cytochrome b561 [Cognatiyoonia sediminum]|uniref:Cytochrome b561 n=1 Tax=Cognatiyoonia sediminum TaxID=1508389 RepID=A0A1M5NVE2_9RHOB|nr:cytochrome b/b6 domain-containing protein [Cognatiyoonia sediminum]SHG93425.1 cytochrome b561 [Cognatiyoonia sediminum]